MPLKFATLGALMAAALLAGCSTTSSQSAKEPVAAESETAAAKHRQRNSPSARRHPLNCWIRRVPRLVRKMRASSSQTT